MRGPTPGSYEFAMEDILAMAAEEERSRKARDGLGDVEDLLGKLLDGVGVGWSYAEIIWEPRGDLVWPAAVEWLHPRRLDRARARAMFEAAGKPVPKWAQEPGE